MGHQCRNGCEAPLRSQLDVTAQSTRGITTPQRVTQGRLNLACNESRPKRLTAGRGLVGAGQVDNFILDGKSSFER